MASAFTAFLGSGLVRPFIRDKKNDFANDTDVNLIRACVGQILGTRAGDPGGATQGELLWRPNFGAKLYLLKHARDEIITSLGAIYVKDALSQWEPRVTNVIAQVNFSRPTLTATIDLIYDIIAKNNASNQVLISGVDQNLSISLA